MPRDDGEAPEPAGAPCHTFATLAMRLAARGYSPISLDGKAPAKGRALIGWRRRREPDPAWVAEQVRAYPGAGASIR
jgi:hypothetical protein